MTERGSQLHATAAGLMALISTVDRSHCAAAGRETLGRGDRQCEHAVAAES